MTTFADLRKNHNLLCVSWDKQLTNTLQWITLDVANTWGFASSCCQSDPPPVDAIFEQQTPPPKDTVLANWKMCTQSWVQMRFLLAPIPSLGWLSPRLHQLLLSYITSSAHVLNQPINCCPIAYQALLVYWTYIWNTTLLHNKFFLLIEPNCPLLLSCITSSAHVLNQIINCYSLTWKVLLMYWTKLSTAKVLASKLYSCTEPIAWCCCLSFLGHSLLPEV